MAPVPVHTASPINTNLPSHPFGVSSPSAAASRYTPSPVEGRPASTEPSGPSFLQQTARPGAPAVPQPTNTLASSYNNRYEPTSTSTNTTTATSDYRPPPPQPGAVPSPFANPSSPPSAPLPPRPLEIPQYQQQMPPHTSPPRQAVVPVQAQTPTQFRPQPIQSPSSTVYAPYTPTRSIPPAGVTSTTTSPSYSYSYPQPQDLSHPPGYQQDHHSSFDDKPVESCQENGYGATLSPLSYSRRGGILDGEWNFGATNGDPNGTVVQTAMSWAKAAGKRLSETERQFWKHINGEDDA